ncbi:hypothetical protein RD792_013308 [Penstemon davidsonii]|uniref:ABC transporter domain-containing protein n=1 Tax=Penstemon davidsonii TaxID=160366 RepID=A0ABR0CT36_9LAMI|nr:hypothetical protein RD792_013308 [Penstemon davidsonii]
MNKTDDNDANSPFAHAVTDPKPIIDPPIPPCEDKFFIATPCFDFVWSGDGQRIDSIVSRIMANNPGRSIPPHKVKSFKRKSEMTEWLINNSMRTPGALQFEELNPTVISYGTKTNSTTTIIGRNFEDPTFKFQMPLQLAASREIARSLIGDPNFSWHVGLKEFAHPAYAAEKVEELPEEGTDFVSVIFYLAPTMFMFVFQIGAVVSEKDLKHRQALTIMGLFDTAYWGSWMIWNGLITIVSSLVIVVFGLILRMDLFVKNNVFLVFLFFFLFQFNMSALGLVISTFMKKASSATSMGFLIFILCVLCAIFGQDQVYGSETKKLYKILWSLFPPNLFQSGLNTLFGGMRTGGIKWSNLSVCEKGTPPGDCFPLSFFMSWLIGTIFLWIALTLYLDNVIPTSSGARKSYIYFLKRSYWNGRDESFDSTSAESPDYIEPDDEGVIEEEKCTKEQAENGIIDPNVAVQFRALTKKYTKLINIKFRKCCCCCFYCTCETTKPFVAVRGLWMNFAKDQLFCLLGPNGAGKTTSISCLTGITPVSGGDVLVYGNSIRSTSGMQNIRRMMGVCAQFDTLWDKMSSLEHLELFASVKGLHPSLHKSEAQRLLDQVKLSGAANIRAGSYSGGMKRRLSFAIALIGDPKLVILDEPTTGMDPIARRHVWSVIESAKQGRSIILTTHSMEEADILSDRIGIMAKGRLRCIGTSTLLKSKFGTGFTAKVSFPKVDSTDEQEDVHLERRNAVKDYFKQHLNVIPKEETKYFLAFVIEREKEEMLEDFFADLERKENEFGILNTEIGLATLEEVFLNISRKAEVENVDETDESMQVTLPSGATVSVPKGAKNVEVPGSRTLENPNGLMVEITWRQDSQGNLCIAGQSDEMPVPDLFPLPVLRATPPGNV